MNKKEKISAERSAFYKAGYILVHILTNIGTKNSFTGSSKEPDITIQDESDLFQGKNDLSNEVVIMCLRAGPLSEKQYCQLKCINYDSGISGDDLWKISRLFYEEKGDSLYFDKYLKRLDVKTEKLLKMNWSFIIIVARQLLKKDLSVKEINDLSEKYLFGK